ncbi:MULTISPECIES: hypothetical protein [Metabacillus]|uniref:Uncharacterized protein n=3 Tax=Metabacillus TaxID=2675233 RepID=A0A179T214_9BACI|nr:MULTISPECIES: hypothetical protein [Metabacillus]OAS87761.1 hypothetical protein A6K24_18650 [Metabacillus litoralis]QNF27260.1 hypothetical protein HUW50_06875 [Metabacillus sp. KUDC1714]
MDKFIHNLNLGAKGLWFPLTVSILLAITALLIPKKNISWKEMYITFGIVGLGTWISDSIIARAFDLIDLGDPIRTGIGDILSYTFIPTSIAILFLNYFTKENKWRLTILFTVLSFMIDTGMIYFGYMKYKGWNTAFSLIVFIIAFSFLLPIHLKIIRR